jgi:hypothetical protein
MIPPKAIDLIIRHIDAIDMAVASRLNRKRPWLEPALTSLLCELLDADTQNGDTVVYNLQQLNDDLRSLEGSLTIAFEIETHEYDPDMEHWVTQADIGLVVNFIDYLLPEESWRLSWLLQAKRMNPDSRVPLRYTESSRFGSTNLPQQKRIEKLVEIVGVPFIKYLLYCPRPANLEEITQTKLAHLRNSELSGNIFDYTLGLKVRDELGSRNSSLAAGLFVADIVNIPKNLGQVHQTVLEDCYPLSWFLCAHLLSSDNFGLESRQRIRLDGPPRRRHANSPAEEWAHGIVTGNQGAIRRLMEVTSSHDHDQYHDRARP